MLCELGDNLTLFGQSSDSSLANKGRTEEFPGIYTLSTSTPVLFADKGQVQGGS